MAVRILASTDRNCNANRAAPISVQARRCDRPRPVAYATAERSRGRATIWLPPRLSPPQVPDPVLPPASSTGCSPAPAASACARRPPQMCEPLAPGV